jgi:hypothetical protein
LSTVQMSHSHAPGRRMTSQNSPKNRMHRLAGMLLGSNIALLNLKIFGEVLSQNRGEKRQGSDLNGPARKCPLADSSSMAPGRIHPYSLRAAKRCCRRRACASSVGTHVLCGCSAPTHRQATRGAMIAGRRGTRFKRRRNRMGSVYSRSNSLFI